MNRPVRLAVRSADAALPDYVFADESVPVYAVLDGAALPDLLEKLGSFMPAHVCLFRGEISDDLARAAPYLVHIEPRSEFISWLLTASLMNTGGILLRSSADIGDLRKHFRRLLTAQSAEGKSMYFRFYDPRVLCLVLPLLSVPQLMEAFGPIDRYLVIGEKEGEVRSFKLWVEQGSGGIPSSMLLVERASLSHDIGSG